MYINDAINISTKFDFTIYADDTQLWIQDRNLSHLHSTLTKEIHFTNNWIKVNKLKLHKYKTNYVFFQNRTISNHIPPVVLEGVQL